MSLDDGKEKAWELVRDTYVNVPAYRNFLKLNGIKTQKSIPKKLENLPVMNKKNYIEKYSIEERLTKGKSLSDYYMVCTSSGTTGEPTLWPRDFDSDEKAAQMNYEMYKDLFQVDKKKTLMVVTFALGAWTAGMVTARLCWSMPRQAKVTVTTPGLDKEATLRILKTMPKFFEQTIILGYPPFLIDLIDFAQKQNFDFKKINTKIHFTSSGISEIQREKIVKIISKNNDDHSVMGFYASGEASIIGAETPDTVDILSFANKNPEFSKKLFGSPYPPTMVVYDPKNRYIEINNKSIYISVKQAMPLIRYDTKDRGGIFDGKHLHQVCSEFGYKCPKLLLHKKFVFVYGRTDAVRILCNIYTDNISYCIEKSDIFDRLTGYFRFGLEEKGLRNALKVDVYYKRSIKISPKEKKTFEKNFFYNLGEVNADFKMVNAGVNFKLDLNFIEETEVFIKGGKYNYRIN